MSARQRPPVFTSPSGTVRNPRWQEPDRANLGPWARISYGWTQRERRYFTTLGQRPIPEPIARYELAESSPTRFFLRDHLTDEILCRLDVGPGGAIELLFKYERRGLGSGSSASLTQALELFLLWAGRRGATERGLQVVKSVGPSVVR